MREEKHVFKVTIISQPMNVLGLIQIGVTQLFKAERAIASEALVAENSGLH